MLPVEFYNGGRRSFFLIHAGERIAAVIVLKAGAAGTQWFFELMWADGLVYGRFQS